MDTHLNTTGEKAASTCHARDKIWLFKMDDGTMTLARLVSPLLPLHAASTGVGAGHGHGGRGAGGGRGRTRGGSDKNVLQRKSGNERL